MPMTIQAYSDWEAEVSELVATRLEIGYSDASAIVVAQNFNVMQSWAKGLDASETSERLIAAI